MGSVDGGTTAGDAAGFASMAWIPYVTFMPTIILFCPVTGPRTGSSGAISVSVTMRRE